MGQIIARLYVEKNNPVKKEKPRLYKGKDTMSCVRKRGWDLVHEERDWPQTGHAQSGHGWVLQVQVL